MSPGAAAQLEPAVRRPRARRRSHPAAQRRLGAQLGYDRRRFRPNIYFEGADGPVELGWVGRRVRVGDLRAAASTSPASAA